MKSDVEDIPSDLTPLREPTFFILLALSKHSKHGYAILKDVEALSQGRIRLSSGTLYGALARLLLQGVIQKDTLVENAGSANLNDSASDPRQRKVYRLTPFGQRVLTQELDRMQALLDAARQIELTSQLHETGRQGT